MKNQHSPLPWRLREKERPSASVIIENANAEIVGAMAQYADRLRPEEEANARLIVTAVNNHAALVGLVSGFLDSHQPANDPQPRCNCELCETARALLAKIDAEAH